MVRKTTYLESEHIGRRQRISVSFLVFVSEELISLVRQTQVLSHLEQKMVIKAEQESRYL